MKRSSVTPTLAADKVKRKTKSPVSNAEVDVQNVSRLCVKTDYTIFEHAMYWINLPVVTLALLVDILTETVEFKQVFLDTNYKTILHYHEVVESKTQTLETDDVQQRLHSAIIQSHMKVDLYFSVMHQHSLPLLKLWRNNSSIAGTLPFELFVYTIRTPEDIQFLQGFVVSRMTLVCFHQWKPEFIHPDLLTCVLSQPFTQRKLRKVRISSESDCFENQPYCTVKISITTPKGKLQTVLEVSSQMWTMLQLFTGQKSLVC